MECPYKNNHSLQKMPCHWISHPDDKYIRICDNCQNHYDLRDFRKFSEPGLTFIACAIILLIIVTIGKPDNSSFDNDGNLKPKVSNSQ